MEEFPEYARLKALVYGLGRASGIQVTPRRHHGSELARVVALAGDVMLAEKTPADAERLPEATAAQEAVATALAHRTADVATIASLIEAYIHARLRTVDGHSES